ncbi:MAG: type I-B CRISPR-associated protein Cas8b1/Cst1 [Candidatus Thorarchaeota archaeon]
MSKTATRNEGHVMEGGGDLFSLTGNPFVDTGLAVMCVLSGRHSPEQLTLQDVTRLVAIIIDTYSQGRWSRDIHGLFFPNSELANPSVKNGPERYRDLLAKWVAALGTNNGVGNCSICGRRNGELANKTRVPLFGSLGFVNFFPAWSPGHRVCPNCLLAIQFSLMGVEKAGRPLMLHAPTWEIQRAYAQRAVRQVRANTARGEAGIASFGYSNQAHLNAAFDAILEIVQLDEIRAMPTGRLVAPLRFYHFTNYGQGPDVEIIDISGPVFEFLLEATKRRMRDAWEQVVRRGLVRTKKKGTDNEIRKVVPNMVYQYLTQDRSIVSFFLDHDEVKAIGSWDLLSLYLRMVREMTDKRINAIREIADRFLEHCKKEGSAKRILQLHYARSYRDFRSVLLRVSRAMVMREGEPLLSFDSFVLDIAPEGGRNWQEIRDLLLFRIYEQGASWLRNERIDLEPVEEAEVDTEQEAI